MKQKIYTLLFSLLFSTILLAQESIDKNLIGFWQSEIPKTKEDPLEGKWLINRKEDGTYTMYFELLSVNDTIYAKQTGTWKIDNGKYIDEAEMNGGDIFSYKINGNKIDYRLIENRIPQGYKTVKYSETKSTDKSEYYEDKYSIFVAKTMKQTLELEDQVNGFTYDFNDGIQDERFVGVWVGSEKDNQVDGLTKKWEMTRNADGTFEIKFNVKAKGQKSYDSVEKGKWWVKDNKFYEYHEDSEMADVYTFEVLNKNQIKFTEEKMSFELNKPNYEFIDTRKK